MDILIKGIEMPKRCTGCFNSKCLLFFEHIDPNNSRHPSCPLVALPELHGRLGDLDFLEGLLDEVNSYGAANEITYKKMIEILHDETLTPTIVEASE